MPVGWLYITDPTYFQGMNETAVDVRNWVSSDLSLAIQQVQELRDEVQDLRSAFETFLQVPGSISGPP